MTGQATTRGRPGPGVGRWVLLATAILQAASPALVGFEQDGRDPVVVPPGAWFSIWGLILLGGLLVAVRGLPGRRAATPAWTRLAGPLSAVQVGFVVWLIMADIAPPLTVPVFTAMLALLLWSLHRTVPDLGDRVDRVLVGTALGLYAGWASAAVWVNTATVLPGLDRDPLGPGATISLALLLAGAVGTLVAGLLLTRREPAYAAAGLWALSGVVVSTASAGATTLAIVAAGGALLVLAVAVGPALSRRPARVG